MHDVLVVGAGPAGSMAALVLARVGAKVHLIDRASFPCDKLCGDTLNPGSLAILDGYFTDVDGVGGHGEMHIRPDGYIGVAPLPGGFTNLCVHLARRC